MPIHNHISHPHVSPPLSKPAAARTSNAATTGSSAGAQTALEPDLPETPAASPLPVGPLGHNVDTTA